ncbi:MAG: oligosaccharide flippase family protein [Lachnospiraceae bacterium]|nr:oligosaccharide flippase family protein [Lachnospiraceae bacterium]
MRTKNTFLNALANSGSYVINLVLSFVARTIFIRVLSQEYLGVQGLFGNILSVLSLAELGIGTAMIFHMYKPIAEEDEQGIIEMMNLYRILYSIVAGVVTVAGLILVPFLGYFTKGNPGVDGLTLIYLMYLANTVVSYLWGYKRALIDGHQKGYISTLIVTLFMTIQFIAQIVVLLVFEDFIIYLSMQIICNVLTNITIAIKCDRMYPYLKRDKKSLPSKETRQSIFKNVSAMFMHKLGDVMVNNTDSLIISTFVGLATVGIFDNYRMLLGSVNSAINGILGSFVASVGNLSVTDDKSRVFHVYKTLNFIGFWIHSYAAVAFFVLFNPFIKTWIDLTGRNGDDYLFPLSVVFLIVINFYMSGMRKVTLNFRDAMGLYWYDRYKPIAEVIVNLVVSIVLVIKYGLVGVLIGTFVSTVGVCFWVEALVTYKYGFEKSVSHYFKMFTIYTGSMFLFGGITYGLCRLISMGGIPEVLLKLVACTVLYNGIIMIVYGRTTEYREFMEKLVGLIEGKLGREMVMLRRVLRVK